MHTPSKVMRWRSRIGRMLALGTSIMAAGCASTGATFRSGVGDRFLEHPPYYAGEAVRWDAPGRTSTGHLPITYQPGASHASIFDPTLTPPLESLLAEMNAFLDSLDVTVRLGEGGTGTTGSHDATRVPPDVQFGCAPALPDEDCAERGDSALGRKGQTMRLAVGRPSAEWTAWAGRIMADAGVGQSLVITLEVGQYLTRQRGWRGTKEVELGTSHVEKLPWLTSLETPVTVLQFTGAVVGPDGKAIRIGAEGLIARRTSLPLSSIGAQELITDEDVERLATARRQDRAGAPLVWQAGLRALIAQLVGRTDLLAE